MIQNCTHRHVPSHTQTQNGDNNSTSSIEFIIYEKKNYKNETNAKEMRMCLLFFSTEREKSEQEQINGNHFYLVLLSLLLVFVAVDQQWMYKFHDNILSETRNL